MKKIALFICTLILAAAVAFAVSADDAKFTVELTGPEVVNAGKTVDYVLTVKGIKLTNGILGLDLAVNYDTEVFELADVKTTQPDGWTTEVNKKTAGKVLLTAVELNSNKNNTVKKDGALKFTVSLKVKGNATKTSEISLSNVECTTWELNPNDNEKIYLNSHPGTANRLTVKIRKALAAPSPVSFDNGVAKWSAVENADSYSVQIYKDGKESGSPVSAKGTEYDFSKKLTSGGSYCFTVVAVSDKPEYGDSEESAKSASYTVKGKLAAPKIVLSPDYENGGLKYQITDTNPDGSVAQYVIEIYSGKNKLADYEAAGKAGNLPCDTHIKAGTAYTAKVSAVAENDKLYSDSDSSAASAAAKAAAKIKNITIKTLPKLSYVDGEKLDLSALVVTVNYESGHEDVKFADFEEFGLETSIANGKKLSVSDTGKTIVISFADKFTATTTALTVTTNECTHEKTHMEQKAPSCGEDGWERTICDKCNAVIAEKVLPATGEHQYGDWEIKAEPTAELKGVKERICSVCGQKQTEEIPATGSSATDTGTNPGTTSGNGSGNGSANPPTTDPAVTTGGNKGQGKITDLGRAFLIILIVLFSLIVLFLVGSVYLESRRNKARRARRGGNPNSRNRPGDGRGNNNRYR